MVLIFKIFDRVNNIICKQPYYIGSILIFTYLSIRFFGFTNTYVEFHDNLDGSFVYWSLLYNQDISYFNPFSKIMNIANGIQVGNIFPSIIIGELFFMIMHPIKAYALNELISRLIAFIGMHLLLCKYFINNISNQKIAFWVSLCFSFLPFNPTPFLTISGQPLLLFAFLNILIGDRNYYNWLIIMIFPFYSSLALAGFAICFFMGILWLFFSFHKKRLNFVGFLAIFTISLLYIISNYKLIYINFIDKDFISIRSLWSNYEVLPDSSMLEYFNDKFFESLYNSFSIFMFGQEHAPSLHTYFIIGSIIIAIFLKNKENNNIRNIFFILIFLSLILSIFYGYWHNLVNIFSLDYYLIKSFKWTRVHWLHPLIWYILFFISLSYILNDKKFLSKISISLETYKYLFLISAILCAIFYFYYISIVIDKYKLIYPNIVSMLEILPIVIGAFFTFMFFYIHLFKNNIYETMLNFPSINTLITNPKLLIVSVLLCGQMIYNLNPLKIGKIFVFDEIKASQHHAGLKNTTFEDYFLSETFMKINNYIKLKPKNYRVASIGFSPSIPLYNGFFTLDMYVTSFSVKYKYDFRKIIAKELIKNKKIKDYFDQTGKRCYLFVSDLGKKWNFRKHEFPISVTIDLNIKQFKKMGGKFIFSAVKIDNPKQNDLVFRELFKNNDSKKLNIYLYEAI